MKTMKKLVAILLAAVMVMSLCGVAFADTTGTEESGTSDSNTVTISIGRDSTWDGTGDGRTFTWYRVFSATYDDSFTATNASGHNNGVANVETGTATGISYIANATVAGKLAGTGNLWFTLTDIAGSDNKIVTWKDGAAVTAENMQAAAKWLLDNAVYEANGTLTAGDNGWSATVEKGYYLIESSTGNNLITATTDVDINEKNDYPPLDKTQADEDNTTSNDEARDVAIGDKLDYQVKVTIPKSAKVGDQILVWDKPTTGLTYNGDLQFNNDDAKATIADYNGTDKDENWSWCKLITVDDDTVKGADVVFSFSMTVNSNALTDTDKENESGLKYGRSGDWKYESEPDHVEFKTYFAGIKKVDGASTTTPLEGVKFTLKEGNVEFPVTKVTDATNGDYYIYNASGSSEVVTDADGMIRIRGLDEDKTYTLTETETLPGYNMLKDPVVLNLHEDTSTVGDGEGNTTTTSSYNGATDADWGTVENNKGTELPSTGGIGTTIFYVAGIVLVLGAAAILVARRKVEAE